MCAVAAEAAPPGTATTRWPRRFCGRGFCGRGFYGSRICGTGSTRLPLHL